MLIDFRFFFISTFSVNHTFIVIQVFILLPSLVVCGNRHAYVRVVSLATCAVKVSVRPTFPFHVMGRCYSEFVIFRDRVHLIFRTVLFEDKIELILTTKICQETGRINFVLTELKDNTFKKKQQKENEN